MILNEILDTKFTNFKEDYNQDDRVYETEAKIGDRTIHFYTDWTKFEDGKILSEIEFSETSPSKNGGKRTYQLTGSGNEFAVFAFIKQSIQGLIKNVNPDIIKFNALKTEDVGEGRARLYKKLFKRELKGYEMKVMDDGTKQVKFTLEKK